MHNRRRNKFRFQRAPQARSAEAQASTAPIQQGERAAAASEAGQSSQTRGAAEIFEMVCDRARKVIWSRLEWFSKNTRCLSPFLCGRSRRWRMPSRLKRMY